MLLTAALYLRVSTEDQAREGYSIPAQRERLIAYCRSQGWEIADIYVDDGYSGAKLDERPELTRLRKDAAEGRFDVVVVWKVDRLSRKVSHLAALVEELDSHGVALKSVTEPFDTSHAAGRAFLHMLSVFAELERETIRERSRMGIRRRIQEGHIHGRPKTLGYRAPGDGRAWEIIPEEAEVVRWIYQQYLSGVGSLRIAEALINGVPGLPADVLRREFGHLRPNSAADRVRWILKNPIYAGYTTLGDELYPGRHEAIVSETVWRRVQDMFARRRGMGPRAKTSSYILSGIIRCAECGAQMWGYAQGAYPRGKRRPKEGIPEERRKRRYRYYICANSTGLQGRAKTCSNWGIRAERAESVVLDALRRLALRPEEVLPHVPAEERPDPTAELEARLRGVRQRQRNLLAVIERAPDVEEHLLQRLRELAEEQRRLEAEIAAAREPEPTLDRRDLADWLAQIPAILEAANLDELRELVRTFVKRVTVTKSKEVNVEIYPLA